MGSQVNTNGRPRVGDSCCADTAAEVPAGDQAEELSPAVHAFLKALASPARQRVMLLFARGTELSVGEVAELTGLAQPRASEHLAELRRGGILASRKDGKTVLYRADKQASTAALSELQAFLRHCC
ncbi:metalloregulator ArsR/SmtB family transcription factor [Nonomuraea sp. NPDC055795]